MHNWSFMVMVQAIQGNMLQSLYSHTEWQWRAWHAGSERLHACVFKRGWREVLAT